MKATSDLGRAIEELYDVFEKYPLRPRIELCPCCRSERRDEVRPLHQQPLRGLSPADLHYYAFCAMTTVGDADDFRHFLPRIYELLLDREFLVHVSPTVALGKLDYGHWRTWPEHEQRAIRGCLLAVWKAELSVRPGPSQYDRTEIDDWLQAIALAEDDLRPYLAIWLADDSVAAGANLARWILDYRHELPTGLRNDTMWSETTVQRQQLVDWLSSAGPRDKLLGIQSSGADRDVSADAESALMVLTETRRST